MKKLLLITMITLLAGATTLFAINPIPSYGVKVTFRANFQEMDKGGNQGAKEKRMMNIQTTTASSSKTQGSVAEVYVYKLIGNKVLGPYYIVPGQLLSVDIDNAKWGVAMELLDPGSQVLANVWTGGSQKSVSLTAEVSDLPKE